jgi:hypothetical protein
MRFRKVDRSKDDFEYSDVVVKIEKEHEDFANEMFNFIQELIEESTPAMIEEKFVSKSDLSNHFSWHCKGLTNKKSTKSNVLYDFKYINDFKNYEDTISNFIFTSNRVKTLMSLYDNKEIDRVFRWFFGGNRGITFARCLGFRNNSGPVLVSLYCYSSEFTNNYVGGNTLSILISSSDKKTISIFPIDVSKFETKLNSIIKNYSNNKPIQFRQHDSKKYL